MEEKGFALKRGPLFWSLALLALATVAALVGRHLYVKDVYAEARRTALEEAGILLDRDAKTQTWASNLGGVFVTGEDPGADAYGPLRGFDSVAGEHFVPLCPGLSLELMHDSGRVLSFEPLLAGADLDGWEEAALATLATSDADVAEVVDIRGAPFARRMRKVVAEESCLRCHGATGKVEGDMLGGGEVVLSMAPFYARAEADVQTQTRRLGLFWGLGALLLGIGSARFQSEWKKRALAANELWAQRQRMESILWGANAGTWEWDIVAGEVVINERWAEMIGFTAAELGILNSKALDERLHPDDLRGVLDALDAHVAGTTEQFMAEFRMMHKDGSFVWVNSFGRVLERGPDGVALHMSGTHIDVTEQRTLGERLHTSEALFVALFDQAPIPMVWASPDGALKLNAASIEHLHALDCTIAPADRHLSKSQRTWKIFDSDRREIPHDELPLVRALKGETTLGYEALVVLQDGTEIWEVANAVPIYSQAGELVAGFETFTDVTERKLADERTRESEERWRSLVNNSQDMILLLDPDYRILYSNRPPVDFQLDEVVGLDCFELLEEDQQALLRAAFDKVFKTRSHTRVDIRYTGPGGEHRHFDLGLAPLVDAHGELTGFLASGREITDRLQLLDQKFELERRVLHAQKLESLGILAGGIAHDFNNLLMTILGNADLARGDLPEGSRAHGKIVEIEKASRRAATLATQMLAYSGKGRFVIERIDAGKLLEEMADLLHVSISKKAELRFELAPDLPDLDGDMAQIQQVVMNLITNASEALEGEPGVVSLSTALVELSRADIEVLMDDSLGGGRVSEGAFVELRVSDTGSGMDAATRGRVFDPFFTTKFTGRGLGMSAVQGIVHGHRGLILVESEPGEGSVFRVLLPVASGVKVPRASDGEAALGAVPTRPSGRILVVDDEEGVRDVAELMLERLGFVCATASDGRDALLRLKKDEFDLVLLDLTMPGMDGEETFRAIRETWPALPVVLCSGYSEQAATEHFAGGELAGFLQKPFDLAELDEKLRGVLG